MYYYIQIIIKKMHDILVNFFSGLDLKCLSSLGITKYNMIPYFVLHTMMKLIIGTWEMQHVL